MAVMCGHLSQPRQATLPLDLTERFNQVRVRHAGALAAASRGDYRNTQALRASSRALGRILADEARRSPAERGVPMLELLLMVDRYFPELRGWNQYEALQRHQNKGA